MGNGQHRAPFVQRCNSTRSCVAERGAVEASAHWALAILRSSSSLHADQPSTTAGRTQHLVEFVGVRLCIRAVLHQLVHFFKRHGLITTEKKEHGGMGCNRREYGGMAWLQQEGFRELLSSTPAEDDTAPVPLVRQHVLRAHRCSAACWTHTATGRRATAPPAVSPSSPCCPL